MHHDWLIISFMLYSLVKPKFKCSEHIYDLCLYLIICWVCLLCGSSEWNQLLQSCCGMLIHTKWKKRSSKARFRKTRQEIHVILCSQHHGLRDINILTAATSTNVPNLIYNSFIIVPSYALVYLCWWLKIWIMESNVYTLVLNIYSNSNGMFRDGTTLM